MAENGTSFEIDIPVSAGSAERAAAVVDLLASRLSAAEAAATDAAAAVASGEKAYAAAEAAADRAAKAVERVSVAADAQRGKLQAAMAAGDTDGAERAASKLQALIARQAEAQSAAERTKAALADEAVALEKLRASAAAASDAESAVSEAHAKAGEAAKKAAAAAKAAAGTGKATDTLEGLAKLSGPLGPTVMKVKDLSEGWNKLKSSLGAAGPYAAIAVAFAAIAVGLAAVTAAAMLGVAKITLWAVTLSDKEGKLKKETERLEKTFKNLFSGLKVDKFISAYGTVVDMFDESMASGKAIKVVFESLFQPIVDGATEFVPTVRRAFLQFEILALKALIAIKPYGSVILKVVAVLGVLAAIVGGVVALAVGLLVVNLAAMALGFGVIIGVIAGVVAGFVWLSLKIQELTTLVAGVFLDAWNGAVAFLSGLDLTTMGSDIVQGLINGILKAGPAVLSALGGVVNGAVDGAKSLLGIHSPSTVLRDELGFNMGAGTAVGLEDATPHVQSAIETMVAPPPEVANGALEATASPPEVKAASAARSGGGDGGAASANFAGATFNFYGVKDAEDAEGRFGAMLTRVLEGDYSQLAGEEAPA